MSVQLALQPGFLGLCPVSDAVERLATEGTLDERGAIFTKRAVVEFILDLIGYTEDAPLTGYRLLEPSFGDGDFLLPAIDRLLAAAKRDQKLTFESLASSICAVELHKATFERTRALIAERLCANGVTDTDAERLCEAWLYQGDFLLSAFGEGFSHVVGNPPYVRQEMIPNVLMAEYRQRFVTIYDRADIYVPFIEHALALLVEGGRLGFICADRWMKNKYGKKLRELVSRDFALDTYVDMVGSDAFHNDVSAYPAITVIRRAKSRTTRVVARPDTDASTLKSLAKAFQAPHSNTGSGIREIEGVASGSEPWVLDSFDELALVRRLEAAFPTIEDAGCKVGIGVATGADNAFIAPFEDLDVEPSRKLPLAMTRDIRDSRIAWRGLGVINPFGDDGKLVELDDYPKLKGFLEARKEQIAGRHIALKNPRRWYRTIDRIDAALTNREKLLIPDIKGDACITYEGGELYPHHNLYYVTSTQWDMRALQAVMRSGIARLFVGLYCTRMRGGYLRFQAQYLRRIRLPIWQSVGDDLRAALVQHAESDQREALNELIAELYELDGAELKLLGGAGRP